MLLIKQMLYCFSLRKILNFTYIKPFPAATVCSKPLFTTDHSAPEASLWKSGLPGHSEHVQYFTVQSIGVDCLSAYQTAVGQLEKQAGVAGPAAQDHYCTSTVSKKEIRRRGLRRAQPVPRCHHFLWVSHHVLPLLHSFWDRAVESQLNLSETLFPPN